MKKNIVIIGAGPAGLSCAYHLLLNNKNYNIIIIEESNDIGGISKTINYKGNRIDIGGHRFFTKNSDVLKMWFDVLPLQGRPALDDKILKVNKPFSKSNINPEKDDKVMLFRNRISRIFYNKKFFDYPVNMTFNTIKNMGFVTTCKCGVSYIKAMIFKKNENNLENFYINRFGKKLYSMFFKDYTTKLWGRSPSEIDSSWGSQRVKGISIKNVIASYYKKILHIKEKNKEISLTDYFYYPKYGPGQFYETMAEKIKQMGGRIVLNSKVTKINKKNNHVESLVYEKDGEQKQLKCEKVISSMPMKDLIASLNNVDKNIKYISDNLPYRDFVTVGVLVPKLDLKNDSGIKTIHNGIPDNWIYIQDSSVKMGRIQIFNNWSPYMVKDPINTIWIGLEFFCSEGDDFWSLSDNQIKKIAQKELKKIGFYDGKILDCLVVKIKKAYPAYFDTYDRIDELREYINKIDNLYCIGRNGTHSYNNMDHSILSGMICANLINNDSHNLDELWNVNVDKNYQESK